VNMSVRSATLGPGAGNAAGPSQISGEGVCARARPLNIIAKLKEHIAKILEFIFERRPLTHDRRGIIEPSVRREVASRCSFLGRLRIKQVHKIWVGYDAFNFEIVTGAEPDLRCRRTGARLALRNNSSSNRRNT
jgi:hypothetical protein